MRKMAAAVAVLAVALLGCQPAEPSMTITASKLQPACYNNAITGRVDPPSASKKVVLQRTMNGKWQDWKWYVGSDPVAHIITATVYQDSGTYQLDYNDETPGGTPLRGTVHLRARSIGGTAFSNGVYVTYPKAGC